MFDVGDKVVYKNHGVCEIKQRINFDFGDGEKEYFVIVPVFHDSDLIIRIPVYQTEVLKNLPTKKEALALIALLKDNTSIWIDNVKLRKENFNRLIAKGDEQDIATIIYSIHKKKEELALVRKQISMTDRLIYDRCKKLLFEELALTLKIDYDKVAEYINEHLSGVSI